MYAVHYIIAILCGISCLGHIDKHIKKQINDTKTREKKKKAKKKAARENRTSTGQLSQYKIQRIKPLDYRTT